MDELRLNAIAFDALEKIGRVVENPDLSLPTVGETGVRWSFPSIYFLLSVSFCASNSCLHAAHTGETPVPLIILDFSAKRYIKTY